MANALRGKGREGDREWWLEQGAGEDTLALCCTTGWVALVIRADGAFSQIRSVFPDELTPALRLDEAGRVVVLDEE